MIYFLQGKLLLIFMAWIIISCKGIGNFPEDSGDLKESISCADLGYIQKLPFDIESEPPLITGVIQISMDPTGDQGIRREIYASFLNPPKEIDYYLKYSEGDCMYLVSRNPGHCSPPCEMPYYCNYKSICAESPKPASVGKITITGEKYVIELVADKYGNYFSHKALPDVLFNGGEILKIYAEGDQIEGFETQIKGVDILTLLGFSGKIDLRSDKGVDFEWVISNDDSKIELVIQTGQHGLPSPALIWCQTDDSTGYLHVPMRMINDFLKVPKATGLTNFSWITRINRVWLYVNGGLIEVMVSSTVYLEY